MNKAGGTLAIAIYKKEKKALSDLPLRSSAFDKQYSPPMKDIL